jgi:hypothetical protein
LKQCLRDGERGQRRTRGRGAAPEKSH